MNGNISTTIKDDIIFDTVPPTGSVKINGGALQTSSTSITLTLAAKDGSGSGVAKMTYSTNGTVWSNPETFTTAKQITLPAGDGVKTVWVKFIDNVGNISIDEYSASIILNTDGMKINYDDSYTNSANVTLYIKINDSDLISDISQMRFSDNGSYWGHWETFSAVNEYTLSSPDGSKTVYAQIKDNAGNVLSTFSDKIILDTTKPKDGKCTLTPTNDNTLVINWTAATDTNGIDTYNLYYSDTATPSCIGAPLARIAGNIIRYTHSGLNAAKTHYYRVCALDKANNLSSGAIAYSKTADTTEPADLLVTINDGAAFTNKRAVTLILRARDDGGVAKVCISNTTTCTAWQTYSQTKSISLTSGDGVKTVYVKYKDTAGNISEQVSGTIILDTTRPAGEISINNGERQTNSVNVDLKLSATDNNPGILMQFSNNGSTWSDWEEFALNKAWSLTSGDGTKTVSARFKDAAGNISAIVKDTIILDTKTPGLGITNAPFTTSRTSKEITGTKEAGSTVSISLNNTELDGSLITQTLAGTSWKAQVGTFVVGSNTISVTATDSAQNETVKTLAVTYKPFTSADLKGKWYFVSSGFDTSTVASWTGYGVITIDAANKFSASYPDETSSGEFSGTLAVNSDGTISGSVIVEGSALIITDGKMDEDRSMFTLMMGTEMVTAVKRVSGFQQTDLAGKWYMYGVSTSPDLNSAGELGTMTCNNSGKITSGSLTNTLNGQYTVTAKYTFTGNCSMAADGGFLGTMNTTYRSATSKEAYSGQMSAQKSIAIMRSSVNLDATDIDNKIVLVKDGGEFTLADLDGRWRLEGIHNNKNDGEVYYGYLNIASGKVVDGVINGEALVAGAQFSITATGVVTGSLKTNSGNKYSITTGRLDSTKKIMTLISGVSLITGYAEK